MAAITEVDRGTNKAHMDKKDKPTKKLKLGTHVDVPNLIYHPDELGKFMRGEDFVPLYVELSPTSSCNQKCPFCYIESIRNDLAMPPKLLVSIVKDLAESGVKSCEFQGTGEPFLNKGTPDAIVAGKERGMAMCLVTNGTLTNKKILERVIPCLSFVRYSSMELTPELYARTHDCPESHFDKAYRSLKTAIDIKRRNNLDTVIIASFVAQDFNTPYIVETGKLLKEIGVDVVTVKATIEAKTYNSREFEQGLEERYKDLFAEAEGLSDENFKFNVRYDFFEYYKDPSAIERDFVSCYGCEFEIMIDSDARIYPCMQLWRNDDYCLGDLAQGKSFKEVWFSKERKEAMRQFYNDFKTPVCECRCKQLPIHPMLNKIKNPPLHVNVI